MRSLTTLLLLTLTLAASRAQETFPLWSGPAPVGDGTTETAASKITLNRPPADKANGAAIVICPGGGYGGLVMGGEGRGIAQWLNENGIAGIVLEYRLPGGKCYRPLLDAQQAIRTARFHAKEWGIDPTRIGIIGFSAGGHLASTALTHFDAGDAKSENEIARFSSRPDFGILVYPVIVMDEKTHAGSKANLLGKEPTPEMTVLFSNEKQVTDKTPPTYLAHAQDDKVVDPSNSQRFYEALLAHHVAGEYLKLPSGGHGLNGYSGPMWIAWQEGSMKWLGEQRFLKK